jgi:hypothetical protein
MKYAVISLVNWTEYSFVNISMNFILRRSENTVFRKIGDEYILVPVAGSVADVESIFNLNEAGAAIWDKIDGKRSLKQIIEEFEEDYEGDGLQIEADVIEFVKEMMQAKLIKT